SQPLPHLTRCDGGQWSLASDPWVSIGAGGAVYASSLLVALGPFRTSVAVSVAAGGGGSWSDPVVLRSSSADQIDKPVVLADPRIRGAAYAVWVTYPQGREEGRNRVWLARTMDGGRTWSGPRVIRNAGLEDQFSQLLPGPSAGSLFLAFDEAPVLSADPGREPATVQLQTMRSADGGRSWTQPVTAASFPLSVAHDPTGAPVRAFSANLSAALGPRDSLYLAWCSGSDVFIARSGDSGATWVKRTAVEDSTQTFLPTAAVAGDGTVGVSWYDFRDDQPGTTQVLTDVWLGQSRDAGRTWSTGR